MFYHYNRYIIISGHFINDTYCIQMKSCQPNNAHLIEAPFKVTKDSQASEDSGNGENLKQEGNGLLNTTRIRDVHVSAIVTKVARKIGALWRARRCLSRSSRKIYVKAIVMPDMIYGVCSFSAALRVTQLQRLQAMQNRAIRCIDGSPPCSAMQPLLAANSIYRVTELFKQKLLIFIWRCLNDSTNS